MKPKKKPASKIATGKANTNRKIPENPESVKTFDTALIRKNEFALILAGPWF